MYAYFHNYGTIVERTTAARIATMMPIMQPVPQAPEVPPGFASVCVCVCVRECVSVCVSKLTILNAHSIVCTELILCSTFCANNDSILNFTHITVWYLIRA